MKYLLISGYTDDDVLRRGVFHGVTPFLQKPFTPVQLARRLREVLDEVPGRGSSTPDERVAALRSEEDKERVPRDDQGARRLASTIQKL
jgi:YesN/AraC family two-component response regulator